MAPANATTIGMPPSGAHARSSFLSPPFLLVLGALAFGLIVAGVIAVMDHRKDAAHQVESELTAIADMKLTQVSSWRSERISDASFVANNPQIQRHILTLAEGKTSAVSRKELLEWMTSMYKNRQYGRIVIFNRNGKVLVSVPDSNTEPGPFASWLLSRAAGERQVFFSDLTVRDGGPPVLDVVIPIYSSATPAQPWIASVVLSIDPQRFLFPILRSWPGPSASGELSLVRRDGADVLYLTALRDTTVPPLTLRAPVATSSMPAPVAIRGQNGMLAGVDVGGSPVLAIVRPVPRTAWYLEAKVDQDEVDGPVREYARYIAALIGLALAVVAIGMALFLRKREADYYRREFENAIERQALVRHYDYLTRYANDIVLLFDDAGTIREINNRGESTYGYTHDQLLSMNAEDLGFWPANPGESVRIRSGLEEDAREQHGVLFEAEHRRADGTLFPAEVSARRFTVEGGRFIHAIVRDISERKRAEQALVAAKEQAEEAGTFQRILLENMSHELRTPMQGILGFARLLESGSQEAGQREMAGNILASGRRLMATLDSILLMSELEAGKLAPSLPVRAVSELVDLTCRSYAREASVKGLAFNIVHHITHAYALLDPDLFQRALGYLIENAIKFTASGEVKIEVGNGPEGSPSSVAISVTDTGIGIAPEHQGAIFEAFRQASAGRTRGYEGAGLGLTLASRIVKAMGGTLSVLSAEGRGATFAMVFFRAVPPVQTVGQVEHPPAAVDQETPVQVRPPVLVVEDNFLNAIVARQFLEEICDVVHAADGPRALNCARERQFALVLMDIHLGAGMDGVQVVETLRKIPGYEHVPVAAVTGYTNVVDRSRFENAGMEHFLAKPYDRTDMVGLVSRVLGLPLEE
jgi:PAS domain S-box-containing protein